MTAPRERTRDDTVELLPLKSALVNNNYRDDEAYYSPPPIPHNPSSSNLCDYTLLSKRTPASKRLLSSRNNTQSSPAPLVTLCGAPPPSRRREEETALANLRKKVAPALLTHRAYGKNNNESRHEEPEPLDNRPKLLQRMENNERKQFYVVRFLEKPFDGIDNLVCVPNTWVVLRRVTDNKVFVRYPNNENPFETRARAERKEKYHNEWMYYAAEKKYESTCYKDAELWILSRNGCGPLADKPLTEDIRPTPSSNRKIPSSSRNNSSKSKKHNQNGNSEKIDLDVSATTVNNTNVKPGCSKSGPWPSSMDNEQHPQIKELKKMLLLYSEFVSNKTEVKSVKKTNKDETARTGKITTNKPYPSHQLPVTQRMNKKINNEMNGKPSLVPEHEPVNKERLMPNLVRNMTIASKPSNLMDQSSRSSAERQPSILAQNQSQDINVASFSQDISISSLLLPRPSLTGVQENLPAQQRCESLEQHHSNLAANQVYVSVPHPYQNNPGYFHQELFRESKQRHYFDNRSSAGSRISEPDVKLISPKIPDQINQSSDLTQQRQILPPVQSNVPKSTKQRLPTFQSMVTSVTKNAEGKRSYEKTQLLEARCKGNPIKQDPGLTVSSANDIPLPTPTTYTRMVSLEMPSCSSYESQETQPVNERIVNKQHQGQSLDPNGILDQKTFPDETRVDTTNDIPTSTNNHPHYRIVLEQQKQLFTQIGSNLSQQFELFSNIQRSILDAADTYKNISEIVNRFNEFRASAPNGPSLSNVVAPIISQFTEKDEQRQASATKRISNDAFQYSNKDVNVAPAKRLSLRIVLPPEYDPHDSRWTLKYRELVPGLTELIPQSSIYVGYEILKLIERYSKDCKQLAELVLQEVFNKSALGVCLSFVETAKTANKEICVERPPLDQHACAVLFNYILEYGFKQNWIVAASEIFHALDRKILYIRNKYDIEC